MKVQSIGELVVKDNWYNAGYIFPKGYSAMIEYKDIADPNAKSLYQCEILDGGSKPLFRITCEKLCKIFAGKSPTACWKQILDEINDTLKSSGMPVVKTQVAGPEYFGLNDPVIVEAIEGLDHVLDGEGEDPAGTAGIRVQSSQGREEDQETQGLLRGADRPHY